MGAVEIDIFQFNNDNHKTSCHPNGGQRRFNPADNKVLE